MFEALRGRNPGYLDQNLKEYAVVAPFLPDTEEFLFQVRSHRLNRQPGEVCFPGGHMEAGEDPAQAGIRETVEELMVPEESIRLIAPLDVLITPHHAIVYPFLATLNDYAGTFCRDEVQEVFTVPFRFFLETEPNVYQNQIAISTTEDFPYHLLGSEHYSWGKSTYPVLFYQYQDQVIWGMTARFIHNVVTLYRDI